MERYEINDKTLVLKPKDEKTVVYEEGGTITVNKTPYKIMEDSCAYYGSTLDGRKEGAANLLSNSYKLPVIVEDANNIIFFPTKSPRKKDCIWVSLNNIRDYYPQKGYIVIEFNNGKKIKVKESYKIIDSQILKATRLGCVMQERIKKNTKNS